MANINLSDMKTFDENYLTLKTPEELKEAFSKEGCNVAVLGAYTPGENEPSGYLVFWAFENFAEKENCTFNYTDSAHPIIYAQDASLIVVSPEFLNKNKEQLLDAYYESLIHKEGYVHIDRAMFDNKRLNDLIKQNPNLNLRIGVAVEEISAENQEYLKSHFIKCSAQKNEISTNLVIGYYTLADLKNCTEITISKEDITPDKLKHLKPGTKISLADCKDNDENLDAYSKLLGILESLQNNYQVVISEDLVGSKLQTLALEKLGLEYTEVSIFRDSHDYTLEEYIAEDNYLESLVADIKTSEMSPFEKYLAVYNIVKQFKPYKENKDDLDQSRYLKNIINNDYIVCVGFSKLLADLTKRVGIDSTTISVSVDTSYEDGFTEETTPTQLAAHKRVIVNLKDPKYGIDGYYIADPTWDNNMDKDIYVHAAMTFRETCEENLMQHLTDLDYIFDVQNMSEFSNKVNILIDKTINNDKQYPLIFFPNKDETEYQRMQRLANKYESNALYSIFVDTAKMFRELDPDVYTSLFRKYAYLDSLSIEKTEYYDFLTDLGTHIINHTNQPISAEQLLTAATNARIATSEGADISNQQLTAQIREEQVLSQDYYFPKFTVYSDQNGTSYINPENKFQSPSGRAK